MSLDRQNDRQMDRGGKLPDSYELSDVRLK
jgi:hypothetical protein